MTESDDPNVLLAGAFSKGGGLLKGAGRDLFGIDSVEAAPVEDENEAVTAASTDRPSEQARRNRRRQASLFRDGFGKPTLSRPGLLG